MKELKLPHKTPVIFAKDILSKNNSTAIVRVEFDYLPSLAMIVEASAQSSAAFSNQEGELAFLISVKDIKQIEEFTELEYNIKITCVQQLGVFKSFEFVVIHNSKLFADGTFTLALQVAS